MDAQVACCTCLIRKAGFLLKVYHTATCNAILEENEFSLLVDLLNMRMVEASKQGIPDSHDSQVFRGTLLKKLIPFLRKPLVMVSEPTPSMTETYKKALKPEV